MTRARVAGVAVLLLAIAFTGCLGGESIFNSEQTNVDKGCSRQVDEGRLTPDQPMVVQGEADGAPATARIAFEITTYAGTIHLVLEHNGTQVWDHELMGAGNLNSFTTQMNDLEAGTYTLTATADPAVGDARLELAVTWGGGTCS